MSKYFSDCHNLNDLKKEYLRLIKKYHPDLAKDKSEVDKLNEICAEINNEYEFMKSIMPQSKKTNESEYYGVCASIINGNEEARKACAEIVAKISKLSIDYNYYYTYEGTKWWEDQVFIEMDNAVNLFWNICIIQKIIGNEFANLFELCDFNVEKMRRTVMFLSTGAVSEKDIHTNLTSSNPIPFFDDSIVVDKLPNYDSFLLLSREISKSETVEAWVEFCQKQRDKFYERFYDTVVPRFPSGGRK